MIDKGFFGSSLVHSVRRLLVVGAVSAATVVLAGCTGPGQSDSKAPATTAKTTPIPTVSLGVSPVAKASPAAVASPTAASPAAKAAAKTAASPSPSPAAIGAVQSVTVTVMEQNDSGQSGTAVLSAAGNRTRVVLDLAGSPAGPQPAHIHEGTCDDLNPAPRYPLTNVANGKSEAELDVRFSELLTGTFAVNVHKSPQEASTYVACGNLPVTVSMGAQNASGQDGVALLTALGADRTRVVLELRNSPAGPQPTHIHEGTCANLNAAPRYPLTNVANGKSETEVDAGLTDLRSSRFAVNVHKSPREASTYVSCGDIPPAANDGARPAASPTAAR